MAEFLAADSPAKLMSSSRTDVSMAEMTRLMTPPPTATRVKVIGCEFAIHSTHTHTDLVLQEFTITL